MDALLIRRMMMCIGGSPTPPTPTGIAYIRNTDLGAYIDTGITADSNTRVIVWARNFNPTCGFLFGSREGASVNSFCIGAFTVANTGRIRIDYNTSQTYANDKFSNFTDYHKYELDKNVFKIDDVTIATAQSGTFSNDKNIHLFGLNNNGVNAPMALMADICSAKIYKNDVLVRDFTAVNSPSIGMYDAVSGTLFTNAGSGNFTYGTFDQNAYTRLPYVSCTNQQYIDTGIYGTKSLRVVIKFRVVGTSLSNPSIFGTMQSGVSGTYFLMQLGNSSYKNRYATSYIDTTSSYQIYNNNSTKLTGLDVTFFKDDTTVQLIRNNAIFGTQKTFSAGDSFTTSPDTIILGSLRSGGNVLITNIALNGYIYYAGFGNERNFVPALVNNVAGFYETYNDIFYPSISGTDFISPLI